MGGGVEVGVQFVLLPLRFNTREVSEAWSNLGRSAKWLSFDDDVAGSLPPINLDTQSVGDVGKNDDGLSLDLI